MPYRTTGPKACRSSDIEDNHGRSKGLSQRRRSCRSRGVASAAWYHPVKPDRWRDSRRALPARSTGTDCRPAGTRETGVSSRREPGPDGSPEPVYLLSLTPSAHRRRNWSRSEWCRQHSTLRRGCRQPRTVSPVHRRRAELASAWCPQRILCGGCRATRTLASRRQCPALVETYLSPGGEARGMSLVRFRT